MYRYRVCVLALVIVILTCVPRAWASSGYGLWNAYMIPSAAHLPGLQGTFWRTDLSVMNPYSHTSMTVKVAFLRELQDNSSNYPTFQVTLPARGHILIEDIVWSRFGLTTKGALILWTDDEKYFLANARTYTGAPGTFGQAINGQSYVCPGNGAAYIPGVRNSGQYRTNVGIVNWSGRAGMVRVDAYDTAGSHRGSRTFSLPPWGNEQVSVSSFGGSITAGSLRLTGIGHPEASWLAYASVVDNVSGDAVYLEERRDDVYTDRVPSHYLGGYWQGWMTMSSGSQQLDVNIYQSGARVTAYLYDRDSGFRVATLVGYQESNQVVFTGSSNVFQYLGGKSSPDPVLLI